MNGSDTIVHLRAAGVSLLLDARGPALPRIAHWGADLGPDADAADLVAALDALIPGLTAAGLDTPVPVSLVPERAVGYRGRPGLSGHRSGTDFSPRFGLAGLDRSGPDRVTVRCVDPAAGLRLSTELRLAPSGLLLVRHTLTNIGDVPYTLGELAAVLPVPWRAAELLDLTGRWCRERSPQRLPFRLGAWVREGRRGRPGHDAPLVLTAGTPGFGNRHGELWAVHLGWSGDHATWAERMPDGHSVLGAAELLGPGEVMLAPGEEYRTPWVYGAYSAAGLDGISRAFHAWLRARAEHPAQPRPVVLNTWEAVYFDHDLDRLRRLADTAAEIGVERFVLDDGWFGGRRDDTAGLGDWYVSPEVWPEGLGPLVEHVRGRGMQFGLWVEPEMVNADSDLYRGHPDWLLGVPGRLPVPGRGQQLVDLANPDAYGHLLERLDAILTEYPIDYLKWDHNRDLVEAAHDGRPGVHAQTLALYRLLDELRARHKGLEIESCASGGGRIDLGILERTDRVWASDTNDALERQHIQRWTELLLPPELVGAHIGPPTSHTTGRTHTLSFRAATALFGHFGIEWDIAAASPAELAGLARTIEVYKRLRGLLHSGEMVHADEPDPAAAVSGVVAQDRAEAVFAYVRLATSTREVPGPVLVPGLEPGRRYRVVPLEPAGPPEGTHRPPPPWYTAGAVTLTGAALATTGLAMPNVHPEQALLLHLSAE